ncbi:MAG: glycosyltransferase family 39 protein [Deltaproteobacteria bacterium]|nr:glycosyltransferase family 39 protein [Deltaproteobacteria bacterium]
MTVAQTANESKMNGTLAKPWHSAGIFGCAFLFLVATMNRDINCYDESLILFGAVRILSGDVPYRDFYANYGPAQYYVLAALFKLFGTSVIVERLWDLIIRSSTILIIYLIINEAWSRRTALATAFAAAFWLTSFEYYGYPVFPCLFFSLWSLYCALPMFKGRSEPIFPLASGACIGMVALFRYDIGALATVGGLFTLGLFHLAQNYDANHKRKTLIRSTVAYVFGIMLVSVPVLFLLLSVVSLHDIWFNLVHLQASTYVRFRSLPFPSVAGIVRDAIHMKPSFVRDMTVYLPILGTLVGGVAAFPSGAKRLCVNADGERCLIRHRRWILVQLSAFSALFFLKGFVRVSVIHMALSIVPALMIVCLTIEQWRQLPHKVAVILFWFAFTCFTISSLLPILSTGKRLAENVLWIVDIDSLKRESGTNSCYPPEGLERIRCFSIDSERLAAIHYIQQRTRENEYIYVGLNRHDKIIMNDIVIYFASKRLSATKWHQFDPGIQTTKEIQSEIISDLRLRTPRYVVLNSEWDELKEPNESALSSGVMLLDDFLKANYRLVASFGRLDIRELTTETPH